MKNVALSNFRAVLVLSGPECYINEVILVNAKPVKASGNQSELYYEMHVH